MPVKPTMVYLPRDLIEQLDKRAAAEVVSRSQVIRDAVMLHLELEAAAGLAERVRFAYEAHPLDTPDAWGDLSSFLDAVHAEKAHP